MWLIVMVMLAPVYVGLIVVGRALMKKHRDSGESWRRALGGVLVGTGALVLVLGILTYPIFGMWPFIYTT